MRWAALPLLLVVLLLFGCDGDDEPASNEDGSPPGEIAGDAEAADVRVIEEWANTLRHGDVAEAARFFAIPSVAENGPTLIRIESITDARVFNASLPCGARLIGAEDEGEFTVATFRLTERPGPGVCGLGTGGTAQTAFVIEGAKIAEWRRVDAGGEEAPSRST